MAGQVDALYIYLLLVAGVMTGLIYIAVTVLAINRPVYQAMTCDASRWLHNMWFSMYSIKIAFMP